MAQPRNADPRRARRGLAVVVALAATVTAVAAVAVSAGPQSPPEPTRDPLEGFLPPAADTTPWLDVAWLPAPDPTRALGGPLNQYITQIVAGGPGLVAIGSDAKGDEGAQLGFGSIWSSTTGTDWWQVELVAGVQAGDSATPRQIVAGPSGLVIAGDVCCREEQPALWWSVDGADWERVPVPEDIGRGSYIAGIAVGPDGYVAVGSVGGNGAIWTSPEGRLWTSVDPAAADLLPGSINGVARRADGWIAVGRIDGRPTADGGVWLSPDLTSWRRVPDARNLAGDDEVELYRAVPFAGGILGVGGQGTHEDRLRCEQGFGHAGRLASIDEGALAYSCGWTYETHYLSNDGVAWERLPDLFPRKPQPLPDPLPPHRLISWTTVTAGGPGLVVVDAELIGRADSSSTSALWTSADGRMWTRVGNGDQLPPNEIPSSIAIVGRQVIAGGTGTLPDAKVWIGTILP